MLQFEFSRQKYLEILYSIWLEIAWLDYGCFGATYLKMWLFGYFYNVVAILATFWNFGYFLK